MFIMVITLMTLCIIIIIIVVIKGHTNGDDDALMHNEEFTINEEDYVRRFSCVVVNTAGDFHHCSE